MARCTVDLYPPVVPVICTVTCVCVCERLKSTSYPGSLWLSRFGSCAVVRTQPDKAAAWLGAGIPRLLR